MWLALTSCEPRNFKPPDFDVSPILDLDIPDDMDLNGWERDFLGPEDDSYSGVFIEVDESHTLQQADQDFKEFFKYYNVAWSGGESPVRYRLFDTHAHTNEFGSLTGVYETWLIIQKGTTLIKINEHTTNKKSQAIQKTVNRLAAEWETVIQSGDYPKKLPGRMAFEEFYCNHCHSIKEFSVPEERYFNEKALNLFSLYGSQEELADGSCITVDEAYLYRAITRPADDLVFWWGPYGILQSMTERRIPEEQTADLVAYLVSLAGQKFECRERPVVQNQDDILGKWYTYITAFKGRILSIVPEADGGYRILMNTNLYGDCYYDENQQVYLGRYITNEGGWSEPDKLSIQILDANAMILRKVYSSSYSFEMLLVRQEE